MNRPHIPSPVPASIASAGIPWTLGATSETYGVRVWVSRVENLQSHMNIILDYLPEDSDWLRNQVRYAIAEAERYIVDAVPTRPEPVLHEFNAHRRYPWFCADCGYAPHEPLMHIQPASAMSVGTAETAQQAQGDSPPARPEGDAQDTAPTRNHLTGDTK